MATKLKDYLLDEIDLSDGAILEPDRPYLIPLQERLDLPDYMQGRANPKSSTGRVDVFTRVISDKSHRFDDIDAGYAGPLFLEVVSRSFTVRVREGMTLNQLRLSVGSTSVPDEELSREHSEVQPIAIDMRRYKVAKDRLVLANGLFLTLDLHGVKDGVVGYRARRNSRVLDLTQLAAHQPRDFWDEVYREDDAPRLVLEPDAFYLLISAEAVRIPPDYAAEMSAYAESSGELRSHYAGFFDPGFGHDPSPRRAGRGARTGTRAVLEVRARDVPFMVEQHQPVCRLTFERMSARPTLLYGQSTLSNYQGQDVVLSKHFERTYSFAGQMSLLEGL